MRSTLGVVVLVVLGMTLFVCGARVFTIPVEASAPSLGTDHAKLVEAHSAIMRVRDSSSGFDYALRKRDADTALDAARGAGNNREYGILLDSYMAVKYEKYGPFDNESERDSAVRCFLESEDIARGGTQSSVTAGSCAKFAAEVEEYRIIKELKKKHRIK